MKTEDIVKKLRHSDKETSAQQAASSKEQGARSAQQEEGLDKALLIIGLAILFILFITALIAMHSNRRASDITSSLDPERVRGLQIEQEFNPHRGTTVINVQEGQDRPPDGVPPRPGDRSRHTEARGLRQGRSRAVY